MNSENEKPLTVLLEELLIEVRSVSSENFDKWYEKKRKVFNIGVKNYPTKEEFIKYVNYALSIGH
ncbi:MAG: hypothetical protein M0Z57_02570 [Deltaproteobacteria bacterium]|jgi:hypothetical protein|uniref:Uncharacterized protein n=1 Tax=Candidatus Acidulodesulfobacterium acidiphilum TaxID=2597224 RepID=A0A520XF26_9DELT|nr:hypothetical protein [Deltaproteobacteria bacterium]MDA8298877.1 hypothetical protein [Deltaproteobacteria bacterium]RZV39782.1 MAG: hypothetical protein EVJ48_03605 [Candidatus Acidulodesulfobacterium acidiphilum]